MYVLQACWALPIWKIIKSGGQKIGQSTKKNLFQFGTTFKLFLSLNFGLILLGNFFQVLFSNFFFKIANSWYINKIQHHFKRRKNIWMKITQMKKIDFFLSFFFSHSISNQNDLALRHNVLFWIYSICAIISHIKNIFCLKKLP